MANSNNTSGQVDTSNFPDALKSIETMAKSMEGIVDDLNDYKANLTRNWVGEGRNEFEKSYKIMIQKLQDGADITWDVYENLIKSQEELIQADIDAAKGIK